MTDMNWDRCRSQPSYRGGVFASTSRAPKARRWYRYVYSDLHVNSPTGPARRCGQPSPAASTPIEVALARRELERARAAAQQARGRYQAGEDGVAEVYAADARIEQARRALTQAETEARARRPRPPNAT